MPTDIDRRTGAVRPRAYVAGALLCFALAAAAPHTRHVLRSSLLDGEFLPFGVVLGLMIVSGAVNPLAVLARGTRLFTPAELAVIFIMGLVTTAVSTDGLATFLLACIAAPYYYATPENRWAEFLFEHMPSWLVPSNADNAMGEFFQGLSPGRDLPWSVWMVPLFWWLLVFAATFFTCACIAVILHRQWAEHERLTFPLMQVPLSLAECEDSQRAAPPFARSPVFWLGFAASCLPVVWNIATYFYPVFPKISLDFEWLTLSRDFPRIRLLLLLPIIGFLYFVNLDVLLSVWAFYLLGVVQIGIYNWVGFHIGRADIYCSGSPSMGWQGFGAMAAMVLWGLWMARSHLRQAWSEGLGARRDAGSGDGRLMSYRTAWVGLVLGTTFIAVWLHASGMEWRVTALFLFAALVIFLGLTRIVVQTGIVFVRAPLTAQSFSTHALGTATISSPSLVSLGLTYSWIHTVFFFMPVVAHAARLGDLLRIPGRSLRRALLLGLLVAVPTAIAFHLLVGYRLGAQNFAGYVFRRGCTIHYDVTVRKMANPERADAARLLFFGIGAAAMLVFTQLHYRLPWWPLLPVGMTIASTWPTRMIVFSLFLAWLAKFCIVKAGGLAWYERFKPLFLGLVVGYFTGLAISLAVDLAFFGPGQGHPVYSL